MVFLFFLFVCLFFLNLNEAVQNPSVSNFWRDETENKNVSILPTGINH